MILSKKIRLKPTIEQEKKLWASANIARWAYNWTLGRQTENYETGGKFIQDGALRKELTQLKQTEEFSWLNDVSNNVCKQAVKDACDAYKKFFKGLAKKPKFKAKHRSIPKFYNDNVKLKAKPDKTVLIEKVGWVKTSEQLPVNVNYRNPRIRFDGKYWYLAVGIDTTLKKEKLTDNIVGIDVGIKVLAFTSDGEVYQNINKMNNVKKLKKKLRRLQRRASKKYEMSKEGDRYTKTCNLLKIEKELKRLHRRLTNIRNNHIHQATNAIAKTKPCMVVMEDLNVVGMMKNRHLAKAIAEQKLGEFTRQMGYKCEKYGIAFVQVGRWYPSSKMCSKCGHIKKDLNLSDRVYHCVCGNHIDRDWNASINLANYGKLIGPSS